MGKLALLPEGTTIAVSIPDGLLHLSGKHPEAERVQKEHGLLLRDCLTRHGVDNVGSIMGNVMLSKAFVEGIPWAEAEELVTACLVGSVLLEADDIWEQDKQARAADAPRCMKVARGEFTGPLPPYMRAFREAYARFRPFWTEQGWEQAMGALGLWADLMTNDPQVIDAQVTDLSSYMAVRRIDFGFNAMDVLMHKSNQMALLQQPPSKRLMRFRDACSTHAVLVNDLLSFRREHFTEEFRNAIQVLINRCGMSLQDAVDEVCRKIGEAESAILALSREPTGTSTGEDAQSWNTYCEAWKAFLASALRTQLCAARYHGPNHVWTGELPARITLYRDKSVFHYS